MRQAEGVFVWFCLAMLESCTDTTSKSGQYERAICVCGSCARLVEIINIWLVWSQCCCCQCSWGGEKWCISFKLKAAGRWIFSYLSCHREDTLFSNRSRGKYRFANVLIRLAIHYHNSVSDLKKKCVVALNLSLDDRANYVKEHTDIHTLSCLLFKLYI